MPVTDGGRQSVGALLELVEPTPRPDLPLDTLEAELLRRGDDLTRLVAEDTGYSDSDVETLWKDTIVYCRSVTQDLKLLAERRGHERSALAVLSSSADLVFNPIGRWFVALPGNAPAPLAVAVPLALLASGNALVLAAAPTARRSSLEMARIVKEAVGNGLELWPGSVREGLRGALSSLRTDAIYYFGGSGPLPQLAGECAGAGIHLLYEGEGRGCVILDETLSGGDLTVAIQRVLESKRFANGRMCSAPNLVAVHSSIYSEARRILLELAANYRVSSYVRDLLPPGVAEYLSSLVAAGTISDRHLEACLSADTPAFLEVSSADVALTVECYSPLFFVSPYIEIGTLVDTVSKARFFLQVSYMTADPSRGATVANIGRFARFCVNIVPTFQNPRLPWGSFGRSGISPVLSFIEKGSRASIIEGPPSFLPPPTSREGQSA